MGLDPIEQIKKQAISDGLRRLSQANADMLLYFVERQREAITANIRNDIDAYLASFGADAPMGDLYVSDEIYEILYGAADENYHYFLTRSHGFVVRRDRGVVGWELREPPREEFAIDTPLAMAARETYDAAHVDADMEG